LEIRRLSHDAPHEATEFSCSSTTSRKVGTEERSIVTLKISSIAALRELTRTDGMKDASSHAEAWSGIFNLYAKVGSAFYF
jgi:hypothetical protein